MSGAKRIGRVGGKPDEMVTKLLSWDANSLCIVPVVGWRSFPVWSGLIGAVSVEEEPIYEPRPPDHGHRGIMALF